MSLEQQQIEFAKNETYRDNYRTTISLLAVMSVVCVGLALVLAYMSMTMRDTRYYATTSTGVVTQLHALNEPVVTDQYMLQWSALAVRSLFNLDFVHYQDQLNQAKNNFTEAGWNKVEYALKTSGFLASITDNKLEANAVISGPAVVLNTAVYHGRYTWRVQMPVLVTYTSASESKRTRFMVTMNVQRVPVLNAYKGIQISDFEVSYDKG